ncbi:MULTISPECIES: efflux RND transporter periplasmic adaptor subunit [Caulobacter]|jgi:cobalt-zinc-cadmium efflux system membrane fusion protein|uniref:Efflux RND transporter periplasmic adaptor subunit n=1 Tax=Caulobacter segnis TaxID=88688 RepID=A0A2W5X7C5_9CAUL|nr:MULTISPECIES: efflux RND transporter periplasmic adaptor subunit [Caulobacter]MDR7232678.1 cobalt-zinc-cadmium efflux system membrane fusion protein [Caulobacter sp. BE264]PZR32781.1 MAG: efflux RND transporter periplasmic adaptor subunit [Caulobacter segnis]
MTRTTDKNKLLAAVAISSLLAATTGVLIGRSVLAPKTPAAAASVKAEQHEEGEAGHAEGEAKTGEKEEEGYIEMNAERLAASGIRVETLATGGLSAGIVAQASVVGSPDGAATLAARADGAVVRINKRLGDTVAAGEALASIESRDAAAISAERSAAAAKATAARQAFAREKRLFDAKITARQDLESAQAEVAIAEAELRRASSAGAAAGVSANGRYVTVSSPIAGKITAAPLVLGSYVTAGTELFRVANPRKIEVQASLPASDAARIAAGDQALIETPQGTIPAVVRSITPGVDVESRAATAILTLAQGQAGLVPGQAVRVRIVPRGAAATDRFSVPEEAVQSVEGADSVFVRGKDGFTARPVKIGRRGGGRIEILSGVTAGEQIAGQGAFLLKAELGKGEAEHGH